MEKGFKRVHRNNDVMSLKIKLQRTVGRISPIFITHLLYFKAFHKVLNLKKPHNLNEKIQWLKFYGDTSLWPILADKYKVREYVENKGYKDILVKLYGAWKDVESIDLSMLPNQFVLKLNNGCGDIFICNNKSEIDKEAIAKHFSKFQTKFFGFETGVLHYRDIEPCIIAEELLDCSKQSIKTTSLVDYKFWCINGVPLYCLVVANRNNNKADLDLYDMKWERHQEYLVQTEEFNLIEQEFPKPINLSRMIEISKVLSQGHPQMRVDLYEVGGSIYFGELTMTSACGLMTYFSEGFLNILGEKMILPIS